MAPESISAKYSAAGISSASITPMEVLLFNTKAPFVSSRWLVMGTMDTSFVIRRLNQLLNEKDKEIAFLKKAAAFFAKEID